MQRHGGSRQAAKGRRTLEPEARKAAKPASGDHSPEQFDQLKRERDEALERLADLGGAPCISSSPGDLQPVFELFSQVPPAFAERSMACCSFGWEVGNIA